ncbi:MAG: DUF349 domain-containing protein [Culturomica sp.]|jgi:predicted XRE-type DNA-binding protein|nr:DUF349 domain-containing protein [Culturomica sp.]
MENENTLPNEEIQNSSEVPARVTEEPTPETVMETGLPEESLIADPSDTESPVSEPSQPDTPDASEALPETVEEVSVVEAEDVVAEAEAETVPEVTETEAIPEEQKSPEEREKQVLTAKQLEAEREKNLQLKLQLIEELKELIQKEESLNKTFQEFKEIQERWRNTGQVPQSRVNDLWETWHHHVENFYNYIKINKELRDLDLKRNLDAKIELCEEAEKLDQEQDINAAFKQLQQLHSRWKEIGPIPKEQQDPVWERFKAATGQINDRHHRFFETLKQEQADNLKIKEEICEKAAAIAAAEYGTITEWNNAAKALIDLQEEWRHSGTVPQKERNRIFKNFRSSCDAFFDKKRAVHKEMLGEQEKNLELKIQLCEKVEAIKDSTDWRVTTDKIISCQKEWKKIGPAPRKHSNKVWQRFRAACDAFFDNKNAHFKNKDSEQEKNLERKQALLEEIKQFTLTPDNEENIRRLKEFQKQWSEIGFVPIKQKDRLQEEFRNALNTLFDQLNLDESDKDLEKFRSKINTLESGENKEFKIINEREKLTGKIRQLENDIHTWENNIGFISKSNKSEGLIRELNSRIDKNRQQLSLLKEKLKALDSII